MSAEDLDLEAFRQFGYGMGMLAVRAKIHPDSDKRAKLARFVDRMTDILEDEYGPDALVTDIGAQAMIGIAAARKAKR